MIEVKNLGLIDYQEALDIQMQTLEKVVQGSVPNTLIVCTHNPVVTLGRGTQTGDLRGWSGNTLEVSRGGRATYHGPNQAVIYPILDLSKNDIGPLKSRDIGSYLRFLENVIADSVLGFGVKAFGKQSIEQLISESSSGDEIPFADVYQGHLSASNLTGVWSEGKKLASIGVAFKKWVSYHGVAVNLTEDPLAFSGINPCGFSVNDMTSIEKLTGKIPSHEDYIGAFIQAWEDRSSS